MERCRWCDREFKNGRAARVHGQTCKERKAMQAAGLNPFRVADIEQHKAAREPLKEMTR